MPGKPKPQTLKGGKEASLAELKRLLLAERAERLRQAGAASPKAAAPEPGSPPRSPSER